MEEIKPRRMVDRKLLARVRSRPCCLCGGLPCDAAHIWSKGAGGPDEEWNLMSLCRAHHGEQHRIGILTFIARHGNFFDRILKPKGWELTSAGLWHPQKKRTPWR